MPYGDRKKVVIAAINGLGPSNADESPNPGDAAFDATVQAEMAKTGADHEHATLACALRERASMCDETRKLLSGDADTPWLQELASRLKT
jgi:hypothetical protein